MQLTSSWSRRLSICTILILFILCFSTVAQAAANEYTVINFTSLDDLNRIGYYELNSGRELYKSKVQLKSYDGSGAPATYLQLNGSNDVVYQIKVDATSAFNYAAKLHPHALVTLSDGSAYDLKWLEWDALDGSVGANGTYTPHIAGPGGVTNLYSYSQVPDNMWTGEIRIHTDGSKLKFSHDNVVKAEYDIGSARISNIKIYPLNGRIDQINGTPVQVPKYLYADLGYIKYRATDTTPPTAPNITKNPTKTWSNTDVLVTLSGAADTESGIDKLEYRLGVGAWTTYTAPFWVRDTATVYARATDKSGNVSELKSQQINIDKVAPGAPALSGR